ncbi:hypothetical protein [Synechococcus sp. RS9916]|uniref:hypothetical protein n=1 Tax=Synechococcus sp. RS9916 TaxID=221359 RepID=UPI0000E53F46|nr:hypothetical protein [Synechococcus sp. RS9916]EAU73507.1 hypothetical protein RS9916_28399 [Synechococcus sp. RS9916]
MQEWTGEFIEHSQRELKAMVGDWKYDFGADDRECSMMLLWMAIKLNPDLAKQVDLDSLNS